MESIQNQFNIVFLTTEVWGVEWLWQLVQPGKDVLLHLENDIIFPLSGVSEIYILVKMCNVLFIPFYLWSEQPYILILQAGKIQKQSLLIITLMKYKNIRVLKHLPYW